MWCEDDILEKKEMYSTNRLKIDKIEKRIIMDVFVVT